MEVQEKILLPNDALVFNIFKALKKKIHQFKHSWKRDFSLLFPFSEVHVSKARCCLSFYSV